jgi:hypothetical protein
MSEIDYVVRDLKISQKAQFNMVELYRTLKSWLEINRYIFYERLYEDVLKKNEKSVKIKWEGHKYIDDYTKFVISISLKLTDYEIIETKKEKLVDGKISISFEATIETDYEEKWEKRPIWVFIRALSDKYFTNKKRKKFEKELKDDTYDLYNKTKTFLNLYKFT